MVELMPTYLLTFPQLMSYKLGAFVPHHIFCIPHTRALAAARGSFAERRSTVIRNIQDFLLLISPLPRHLRVNILF